MNTRNLLALGILATTTLATLRALPHQARRRREKKQYDAVISTWEGEGGSGSEAGREARVPETTVEFGTAPLSRDR